MINDKNIEEVIRIINKFGLESNIEYFKNGHTAKLDDLLVEHYNLDEYDLTYLMMNLEDGLGLSCDLYLEMAAMGGGPYRVKDIVNAVKRYKMNMFNS